VRCRYLHNGEDGSASVSAAIAVAHCVSVNERRPTVAHARAVAGVIRVIPTRTLEPALSSVYGTRIIIYMYRRVYIIISGIIHAGNEVFCNTRGGGDDRRRSYYIGRYPPVSGVYLCGFMGSRRPVVSFAVN